MVRSDEDIKKIIIDELTRDKRIDASKIRVEVKNSKVTLSGEVPSAIAQSSANWITTAIPEVTDVINHFTVRRPAALTMAADEKKAAGNKNSSHFASRESKSGLKYFTDTVNSQDDYRMHGIYRTMPAVYISFQPTGPCRRRGSAHRPQPAKTGIDYQHCF